MSRAEQEDFRKIDFSIDPAVISQAESLLRAEPNVERSAGWIQSPEKLRREKWLSLFLLTATFPALTGACLGVLATDGRPAFHQVSGAFLGPEGMAVNQTNYFKVRTLVRGAEQQELSPLQTTAFRGGRSGRSAHHDPRSHSRFGALLRRSSVDELPQLLSVVKGEMALVGPRGYTPMEIRGLQIIFDSELLPAKLKGYREVIACVSPRPGIFGLYSATLRKDLTFAERLILDLEYCQRATPEGDMRMFLASFSIIIRMIGAR